MRRLLTALILIAFFSGCGQQPSQPNEAIANKLVATPAANRGSAHQVDREEAARLISAFLNHPKLGPYGMKYNIGGMFDTSVFSLSEKDAGSLLWYGYDSKAAPDRQLTLAAGKVPGYSPLVTREAVDDLWKPYDYFPYTGSGTSEADVLKFIETHTYGTPGTSPRAMAEAVRREADEFMTLWVPQMETGSSPLMKYSFSFFGDMSSDFQITKLIGQQGAIGVRYYFGYEEEDGQGNEINNKIRVILVAVDEYGKNILSTVRSDDDLMLQRAFPPPPNN